MAEETELSTVETRRVKTTQPNVQQPEAGNVIGYASLASFIASDKDGTTVVYRRFKRLSARSILYLQSELAELEARQVTYDEEDLEGSMDDAACARDWNAFKKLSVNDDRQKHKMELVRQIRETMKQYKEAIFLENALLAINKPSSRTVTAFQHKFNNVEARGGSLKALRGASSSLYDDPEDLMVLAPQQEEDRLTRFLRYYFAVLFEIEKTESSVGYFSESRLRLAAAIINLILAAVLLFGAIYNLYTVTGNDKRLGLIAGYTVAFAACVGFATNAKRSEVFTACAAYAAVLVVFVSGNLGSPS